MKNIIFLVDKISEWFGKVASWISLLLIILINYEVIARYVFNKPTEWSYTMSFMLGGAMYLLGEAYVTKCDAHVRVDLFYANFSKKVQLLIDIIFDFIFSLPVLFILSMLFWGDTIFAFTHNETFIRYSPWAPIAWPFKLAIAIGFSLNFIQVIANLIKKITAIRAIRKEVNCNDSIES